MNKIFKLFTWLMLSLPFMVEAQDIRVLSENLEFVGDIGSSQRKSILIQNESDRAKTFYLKNIRGSIGSSQNMKICVGEQCFDVKRDLAKVKLTMEPGEIITDVYVEFSLGIAETRGSFDLFFVNVDNIRDAFLVEAQYDVTNPERKVDEFDYEALSLSDVYPNPSNRVAHFDYLIKNRSAVAKISINSFIGNPVAEYELDPERTTLQVNVSDLNPGVYFYTLFVDNKNIVTKKLVVKK
ncbi:T9SS type A sorting domain-containing protein [Algoriphagus hitonicola]|uniref:Por secretion system C-terminal sorting domain-containing protein n=1 Tax=Algoriphagus hitonicola TaxID=435880 RepID=A0A1I2UG74_9BACT|nr:T9SS type A sorting domain-containing protein [Algoriphagus hitonicola]SFG74657.1 Por secretion system C-terminal sorting domain-containing protein [Algoriphagus hitonicola]